MILIKLTIFCQKITIVIRLVSNSVSAWVWSLLPGCLQSAQACCTFYLHLLHFLSFLIQLVLLSKVLTYNWEKNEQCLFFCSSKRHHIEIKLIFDSFCLLENACLNAIVLTLSPSTLEKQIIFQSLQWFFSSLNVCISTLYFVASLLYLNYGHFVNISLFYTDASLVNMFEVYQGYHCYWTL